MSDPLDGLEASRRVGWARSFDAEEAAANMLYGMYLSGVLADDWRHFEQQMGCTVREWLDASDNARGWVAGADVPPPLTDGQVESRIRIARRFLELDGRTARTWNDPPQL